MKEPHNNHIYCFGFSMVEMSVVIAIIAMIIGTMIVGNSLIKDGRFKAIIKEYRFYQMSVISFYDKYDAYPGDFNRATDYWYDATTCPGTSGTTGQCNGDNNGIITANGGTDSDEGLRAWQHMYLSGILTIPYSGIHTVLNQNDIGENVPASEISNAGWVFSGAIPFQTPGYYDSNAIFLGAFAANLYNHNPILNPYDTMALDNKIDDGKPVTGRVIASYIYESPATKLYTTTDLVFACGIGTTNSYNTSYVGLLCNPHFILE